ncbi:MAG: hypothetical protein HPY58_06310 [Firmicutes bacterium]|nr:hypothetical protein [Bacillota bacterium]
MEEKQSKKRRAELQKELERIVEILGEEDPALADFCRQASETLARQRLALEEKLRDAEK